MEAVNLLPAYARPGHRWAAVGKDLSARRVLVAGGAAACVAVVGLGFGYAHERSVINDKRATLAVVQGQVAAAEATAAPLRAAQAQAAARLAAAGTISASRIPWESVLRDLSRVLPGQVYLQNLQAQSPATVASAAAAVSTPTPGAAPTSPTAFTATGVASSQVRVALVLDRLALLPWLSNVMLQSTTRGATGSTGAGGATPAIAAGDMFSISADFNATGGAK